MMTTPAPLARRHALAIGLPAPHRFYGSGCSRMGSHPLGEQQAAMGYARARQRVA
jgi:hypothetical protein